MSVFRSFLRCRCAYFAALSLTLSLLFFIPSTAISQTCLAGDSNLDGKFDTDDLVLSFQHGKYHDGSGTPLAAGWESGDWNGDGVFNWQDLQDVLDGKTFPCPGSETPATGITNTEAALAVQTAQGELRPLARRYNKVLAIRPFANDLNSFLQASPVSASKKSELRYLHDYLITLRTIANGIAQGSITQSVSGLPAVTAGSGGLSYSASFQSEIENLGFPLPDLNSALILSYVKANSKIGNQLLDDMEIEIRAALESLGSDPKSSLASLKSNTPTIVEELQRGARAANMEFLLAQRKLPAFDNLGLKGKPDLKNSEGFLPVKLLTSWYFFPYDQEKKKYVQRDRVHTQLIRDRMKQFAGKEKKLYVIDIEHWKLTDVWPDMKTTYMNNVNKLGRVADAIHQENPGMLVCFYSMLPQRDYSSAYQGPASERYADWERHNRAMAPVLTPKVDAICPSLYTLHVEEHLYPLFAVENIQQARIAASYTRPDLPANAARYARPVIPYTWPFYHPNGGNNPKAWQPIEGPFYFAQLDTIAPLADGIVFWSSSQQFQNSWTTPGGKYSWYEAMLDVYREQNQ